MRGQWVITQAFAVTAFACSALAGCKGGVPEAPKLPPPKVTVVRAVREPVTTYHYFTGQTAAIEAVEIRARVRGFLSKVAFQEGTEVAAGTVLYEIDPREYQATLARAEANVLGAKAGLALARAEEQRSARLRAANAVTEEDYQQHVAARLQTEATLKQAEAAVELAQLDLGYCTIAAPIAGRVGRTEVTVGNLVGYNEPTLLTTLVSLDPMYVYFDAPERDFIEYQELVREARAATAAQQKAPVFVALETETGYPHEGVIDFRGNKVDPNTGTIALRAVLPNVDRMLVPGMFARLRVPIGAEHEELLVPLEAIASDQRGTYVLVVGADDTVEFRSVTTGQQVGERIVVTKGLAVDDRVVAGGTQKARPGGKVTPMEHAPEASTKAAADTVTADKAATDRAATDRAATDKAATDKAAAPVRHPQDRQRTASDGGRSAVDDGPVLR